MASMRNLPFSPVVATRENWRPPGFRPGQEAPLAELRVALGTGARVVRGYEKPKQKILRSPTIVFTPNKGST